MGVQAFDALNPANRIDVATIIRVHWTDNMPYSDSFFAIRIEEVSTYRQVFRPFRVDVLSEQEAERANWVGIKCASCNGVAAWGHAIVTFH